MKTFNILDNYQWVPDADEWKAYNLENKDERKLEWKRLQQYIKKSIKYDGGKGTGHLKIHKSLFFKGEIPKDYLQEMHEKKGWYGGWDKFCYSYLFFYFLYHPNLTQEKVDEIYYYFNEEQFCSDNNIFVNNSFSLFKNMQRRSLYEYFTKDGLMKGKEELLAGYLILGDKNGQVNGSDWQTRFILGFDKPMFLSHFLEGMASLGGPIEYGELGLIYGTNPRGFGQYIWPELSHHVVKYHSDLLSSDKQTLGFIERVINMITFFSEHPKTAKDDTLAQECQDRIITQYRNGEFADWLSEMFVEQEKLGVQV